MTNHTKHRFSIGAACGLLALSVAACGGSDDGGSGDGGSDKLKVAFVIKPLDNTYFGAMAKGAQAEADKAGIDLEIVAAANVTDDSGQANKLNALTSAGDFGCYVVNPTSQTNLLGGLAKVSADDIPIVNLDLPIDLDAAKKANVDVTTYVGTNNETAGEAGGTAMMDLLEPNSKVALIGGLVGDPGSNARMKGFSDKVEGTLVVSQKVAADFDKAKAKSAAATIIRGNPDVKGFFTPSGDMALGIQQAVNEANRDDIAVVGIDGTEDQLKDIVAGGEPAAIEQFPYLMGAQSVQACIAAADGKTIPDSVETPVLIVTKDNAAAALEAFPAPPADFDVPNPFEN